MSTDDDMPMTREEQRRQHRRNWMANFRLRERNQYALNGGEVEENERNGNDANLGNDNEVRFESERSSSSGQSTPPASDGSGSEEEEEAQPIPFAEALREWKVNSSVSNRDFASLVTVLRKYGHIELPVDVRTLMKTPREIVISTIPGHPDKKFCIMNVQSVLARFSQQLRLLKFRRGEILPVSLNTDGVDLGFAHSDKCFWPVYVKIVSSEVSAEPVLLSIYYGKSKPPQLFFEKSFAAVNELLRENVGGHDLRLLYVVADLPARHLVKGICGHTSFHACDYCTVVGESVNGATVFLSALNRPVRSHDDFILKTDRPHHDPAVENAPILVLGTDDIISLCPPDVMHAVDLGVTRRMIRFLLGMHEKKLPSRINDDHLSLINDRLAAARCTTPSDFQRKPRPIAEIRQGRRLRERRLLIGHWTATEFRQFLLYTGLFALQGLVSDRVFECFANLSGAIAILSRPLLYDNDIELARRKIRDHYVAAFRRECFGPTFPTINSHQLLHLCDFVEEFGSLGLFSAYPFENANRYLKGKFIKGRRYPLEEVIKRGREREQLVEDQAIVNDEASHDPDFLLGGRLTNKLCDSFWGLRVGNAVLPVKILSIRDGTVRARSFTRVRSMFLLPFDSSELCMFEVENLSRRIVEFSKESLVMKFYYISFHNREYVIPLPHTMKLVL